MYILGGKNLYLPSVPNLIFGGEVAYYAVYCLYVTASQTIEYTPRSSVQVLTL